ncbi:c-type cytochrome biogenesis protein CcmI [Mameliella sp. CS4]|uniref:c-type cytochrome biogenesis protein CcmI n=1 Tax=Mameliella sp. CS4 TaxID=2862329 RepID=UPI001C5CDBC5|nr:c-type cytochrome biogenesis protein CcmI [Mameliella sp. CS4]MBW4985245.1 c-type cytochrome biogenesis protein CcmI [Mameliella sp. CS4]
MIWGVFVLLTLVAIGIVLYPLLWSRSNTHSRGDAVPAILADQMQEIERDMDRSLISEQEAQAARHEIKKRILATTRNSEEKAGSSRSGGRVTLVATAVLAPVIAAGYYLTMGSPEVPSMAFAARAEERAQTVEVTALAIQLRERLVSDPTGGPSEGWMLLGQTYQRMGRASDAVEAFEVVAERKDATSATFSMLAEAVVVANDGVVIPKAKSAIDRALELDRSNPAATYFKSLYHLQREEARKAYDLLVSRLDQEEAYVPWMETYTLQINRIAAAADLPIADLPRGPASQLGPNAADVVAASEMSDADRAEFIRSMVSRLAERLEDEPEDLDGWIRLANAYTVLQEQDRAIEAYRKAEALLEHQPTNDPRRAAVRDALERLGG